MDIALITVAIVIVGILVLDAAVDILALLLKPVEPLVRWAQRVFFGINEPRVGSEAMPRTKAEVIDGFDEQDSDGVFRGAIRIKGERWSAVSRAPFETGDAVEVVHVDGLVVTIRESDEAPGSS